MEISDLIKYFNQKELFRALKEAGNFYLKPRTYFSNLFQLSSERQFYQTILLLSLGTIIMFFLTESLSLRKLSGLVLMNVIFCLGGTAQLIIGRWLGFFLKQKFSFKEIFLFVLHTKFFLAPFQLGFSGFFKSTEIYEFYFLSNMSIVATLIYIYVVSSSIFFSRAWHILVNICCNVIAINVTAMGIHFASFDNRMYEFMSSSYEDPIFEEYIETKSKLKLTHIYPTSKTVFINPNDSVSEIYQFSKLSDSLSTGGIELTEEFLKSTTINQILIDSALKNMQFERSKATLMKWKLYLDAVQKDKSSPPSIEKENIIKAQQLISPLNSWKSILGITIKINPEIYNNYLDAIISENNLYDLSVRSEYPLIVLGIIGKPAILIMSSDELDKEK